MSKALARSVATSAGIALLLTACGQPVAHQAATAPAVPTTVPATSTVPAPTVAPPAVSAPAATGLAADIEALVSELGHRVTDIAATHSEAVASVARHAPSLVLADIQLADGSSGIDAVKDILKQHDLPVIFITAFPERLLTGERPEPTFLITKPFQPETVKAAIGQALFFHPARSKEVAA